MYSEITKISKRKDFVTEERYMKVIQPIMELAISRNDKYGNSIAEMDDTSIIDLIKMKLARTKHMLYESGDNPDKKVYDEIFDSINFLVYIGIRMNDRGLDMKPTQGKHN